MKADMDLLLLHQQTDRGWFFSAKRQEKKQVCFVGYSMSPLKIVMRMLRAIPFQLHLGPEVFAALRCAAKPFRQSSRVYLGMPSWQTLGDTFYCSSFLQALYDSFLKHLNLLPQLGPPEVKIALQRIKEVTLVAFSAIEDSEPFKGTGLEETFQVRVPSSFPSADVLCIGVNMDTVIPEQLQLFRLSCTGYLDGAISRYCLLFVCKKSVSRLLRSAVSSSIQWIESFLTLLAV